LIGFTYQPRRDGTVRGMVDKYEFYTSKDGKAWGDPIANGEFSNIKANPILQTVLFKQPTPARYFRFVALHAVDAQHVAVAELGVVAR